MGSRQLWHFRTNFTVADHCCPMPRRLVTKQFMCHHVRLQRKSDFLVISCPIRDLFVITNNGHMPALDGAIGTLLWVQPIATAGGVLLVRPRVIDPKCLISRSVS